MAFRLRARITACCRWCSVRPKLSTPCRQKLQGGGGDNNILAVALEQMRCSGLTQAPEVVLISKDINLRIKADAVGLQAEDYVNDNVSIDDLYAGFRELSTDAETIKTLHDEDQLPLEAVIEL